MGVANGQPVDETNTNPAFINKNVDDVMGNILGFNRPLSGATIADIQQAVNNIYDATGVSESQTGTVYDAPASTITNGDSHLVAFKKLAGKFSPATGHAHTGSAGDGPQIQASDIAAVPLRGYVTQGTDITAATGFSTDVSSFLIGSTPSTGDTVEGLVTTAPQNKIILRQASGVNSDDAIVDGSGNVVYARLTYAASVWTLSYYVELLGTQTAYNMPSTDVRWYYQELSNPMQNPPVYSGFASIPSDNATADVITATTTKQGKTSLSSSAPGEISATGSAGTANASVANADHTHKGVHSVAATGSGIYGDVVLAAGTGLLISQSGQTVTHSVDQATATPQEVAATGAVGSSSKSAKEDHVHKGLHSIAATGQSSIYGDAVLIAASGAVLSQSGQNITISADLATTNPIDIATAAALGTSTKSARQDHTHRGLRSIAATGQTALFGDAVLQAGTGISLAQSGQNILIAATGASGVSSVAASGNSGITGAVVLVAGTGVSLSQAGQNITINAAAGTSEYAAIIGTAAQVTAGIATHSSFSSAQSAVSDGDAILLLTGTLVENISFSKKISLYGLGAGSIVSGTVTFSAGSSGSRIRDVRSTGDVTVNSGVNMIKTDMILASGKTFIDNSSTSDINYLFAMQET